MSISNYTELKTAIANWLHISSLSGTIPDFITLAEVSINRRLRARTFETTMDATITAGTRHVALPTDYLEPKALWLTTYTPRQELTYKTPEQMVVITGSTGQPDDWTIDGDNIAVDIDADIDYSITFRYRQRFSLSTTNPTNWLLTNHPDIYLYGSLAQSGLYARDNEQLGIWKQSYKDAFDELELQENKHNQLAVLSTDFGGRRPNIYEG